MVMTGAKVFFSRVLRWMPFIVLAVFVMGCRTTPKVDWAGRIGSYTYDQAVLDLGPPERSAKLTDGTVVAEWLTRRGHLQTYMTYGYGWPYGWYPSCPTFIDTYWPDYFLRLTFGSDGRLKAWQKFVR
jgi:hypothetical protein